MTLRDKKHIGSKRPSKTRSRDGKWQTPDHYEAIVYFHGMGNQPRYEEVSRLTDNLDQFANTQDETTVGRLRKLTAKFEVPRVDAIKDDIAYVEISRFVKPRNGQTDIFQYPLYEAYWSRFTAGGIPSWKVVLWLFKQLPNPLRCLRAAWRQYPRLKRSALIKSWPKITNRHSKDDINRILEYYDQFESWDARRMFPTGSFGEFCKFTQSKFKDDSVTSVRLINLAKFWHRVYQIEEMKILFSILTLSIAIVIFVSIPVSYLYSITNSLTDLLNYDKMFDHLFTMGEFRLSEFLIAGVSIIALYFINKFLRDYLSDVVFWTSYKETDPNFKKREEILNSTTLLLKHILLDENCKAVILVGHSLGTAVAYDALRALGRYNAARQGNTQGGELPLDKISNFVTFGSPIDRIYYFFETHEGRYHRYNRINEQIRGDIDSPPFSMNKRSQILWINFWDQADIVSSELHTPKSKRISAKTLINVKLAQNRFPDPIASHSAYFQNCYVLETVLTMIITKRLPVSMWRGVDKESWSLSLTGNDFFGRLRSAAQLLAVLIPWEAVAAVASWYLGYRTIFHAFSIIIVSSTFMLILYWALARLRPQRKFS